MLQLLKTQEQITEHTKGKVTDWIYREKAADYQDQECVEVLCCCVQSMYVHVKTVVW